MASEALFWPQRVLVYVWCTDRHADKTARHRNKLINNKIEKIYECNSAACGL